MKKFTIFIYALFFLVAACNKPKDDPSVNNKGSASYSAGGSTFTWNEGSSNYTVDGAYSSTACFFAVFSSTPGSYSGGIYTFNFDVNNPPVSYAVGFSIPADSYPNFNFPLNTPLKFDFSGNYYGPLATSATVTFSYAPSINYARVINNCDSVQINIMFTRISNNTLDGTFSMNMNNEDSLKMTHDAQYDISATVNNGIFKNVPMEK